MRKITRRVATLTATVALAGAAFAATSAPANAMPNEWYRCWVSGHGWMWCMDV
ncbi:hypothetical protein Ssi03_58680 [Sphaerisporangium siamense]|uniref:Uncharacterized protein n=1 Tax=Sphaerisporangium siamense TaxID=795645 RepID=A0A7W7G8P0_9ACTN|nr:hypothetical protein [Sphaerisporangium siamense]MBB4699699.1 hypothetical protein [Sphaerisporangium siamense]GII87878.1 hypothetical protein Ssi03_58680 [Sphaerisporangium siamense]